MSARAGARRKALEALEAVLVHGRSLAGALEPATAGLADPRDRGLARELCYGVLRWHERLAAVLEALLERPLRRRDADVRCLLLLGLYQLAHTRIPAHAAVSETVALARERGKPWAASLANAVLRRFQSERELLLARADRTDTARLSHPAWLLEAMREAYPDAWQALAEANNQRAPMALRVNRRRTTREAFLARLGESGIGAAPIPHAPAGVALDEPRDVARLPGFAEGEVSVQDGAAQLAAPLLGARAGHRVLDACAAPGGKCAHLLELEPAISEVVAIDSHAHRAGLIGENLARLGLEARVVTGDAALPAGWWDGRPFDRILLDAPCTATGTIRRHPDIKVLRRPGDADSASEAQRALLEGLWPLLARKGLLLYATCSILPGENERVVEAFLGSRDDAAEHPISAAWGLPARRGRRVLPGQDGMDGFYYALLAKR